MLTLNFASIGQTLCLDNLGSHRSLMKAIVIQRLVQPHDLKSSFVKAHPVVVILNVLPILSIVTDLFIYASLIEKVRKHGVFLSERPGWWTIVDLRLDVVGPLDDSTSGTDQIDMRPGTQVPYESLDGVRRII